MEPTHAVQQSGTNPSIVVLSMNLTVLYANCGGISVLQSLDPTTVLATFSEALPSVLASLTDRILKDIEMRHAQDAYVPFFFTCAIEGFGKTWHCRAFGIPSRDKIDNSRIVLLFSDHPSIGHREKLADVGLPLGKTANQELIEMKGMA